MMSPIFPLKTDDLFSYRARALQSNDLFLTFRCVSFGGFGIFGLRGPRANSPVREAFAIGPQYLLF